MRVVERDEYLVDSLSSQSSISDQSLDSWGFVSDWLAFLFNLSSDDESSDIIVLAQSEELSDLGGSLGSESLGELVVGQTYQRCQRLSTEKDILPAMGDSPVLTIARAMTLRSGPTMHPLTDFLFLSPLLLGL